MASSRSSYSPEYFEISAPKISEDSFLRLNTDLFATDLGIAKVTRETTGKISLLFAPNMSFTPELRARLFGVLGGIVDRYFPGSPLIQVLPKKGLNKRGFSVLPHHVEGVQAVEEGAAEVKIRFQPGAQVSAETFQKIATIVSGTFEKNLAKKPKDAPQSSEKDLRTLEEDPLMSAYRLVLPRLQAILHGYKIPIFEREDILQEVLLAAVHAQEKIKDPQKWFVGTTRMKCVSYWKYWKRSHNMGSRVERVDLDVLEELAGETKEPGIIFSESLIDLAEILSELHYRKEQPYY